MLKNIKFGGKLNSAQLLRITCRSIQPCSRHKTSAYLIQQFFILSLKTQMASMYYTGPSYCVVVVVIVVVVVVMATTLQSVWIPSLLLFWRMVVVGRGGGLRVGGESWGGGGAFLSNTHLWQEFFYLHHFRHKSLQIYFSWNLANACTKSRRFPLKYETKWRDFSVTVVSPKIDLLIEQCLGLINIKHISCNKYFFSMKMSE